MKIIIGIPAFNEEKNIAPLILKMKEKQFDIIVCDDGSTDKTADIVDALGIRLIKHEKNQGYGASIKSIFEEAKKLEADFLVTFDADGQHQISDISEVLKPLRDEKADIVIGSRFKGEAKDIPKYRKIGIKTITELTNAMTGSKMSDAQSGFRAYNKKALNQILISEEGMGVSTEILIKAIKNEMEIIEVPITITYEGNVPSQTPVKQGISVILSTVKHVAIKRPLTYYGIPGVIATIVGIFFSAWTIQRFSSEGEFFTNIALIGISGIIFGAILLITGTILFSIVTVMRENNKK